ncbi:hypothetical protein A2419_01575 [Candidatus Adlerbacteria bacterium RIFOXYC1_FULL_48_26]|uniref:HIT domain-containing protein n=1 Tax=Candidatus Adlerbacteria bacterium RIFOXYC1_FULL_48_26 TaxID=1797247 RepID=A0A1F4Y2G6_9BACT|nr:MAG: hypothetical protein A2419_01575 [Candidatus Adlerbacteria bacterium RIFOXYC1_FULL_48_26]
MSTPTLRTEETEARYQKLKEDGILEQSCALCRVEPKHLFTYWKIIPNEFPYDKIAKVHDMAVTLRHTAELNEEERAEFEVIKSSYINDNYRYLLEATTRTKSIPAHFHIHMIEIK